MGGYPCSGPRIPPTAVNAFGRFTARVGLDANTGLLAVSGFAGAPLAVTALVGMVARHVAVRGGSVSCGFLLPAVFHKFVSCVFELESVE